MTGGFYSNRDQLIRLISVLDKEDEKDYSKDAKHIEQ